MSWVFGVICDFISFLLGRSKKSNDEKLGIAENTVQSQAAVLQEVQTSEKIDNTPISDADSLQLTEKYQRPGE